MGKFEKVKIMCKKCGFTSVFLEIPRAAMCARCGEMIVYQKGLKHGKA